LQYLLTQHAHTLPKEINPHYIPFDSLNLDKQYGYAKINDCPFLKLRDLSK